MTANVILFALSMLALVAAIVWDCWPRRRSLTERVVDRIVEEARS